MVLGRVAVGARTTWAVAPVAMCEGEKRMWVGLACVLEGK